ncbi:MAG: D-alanyl-D-alanine carboxypeptidase [Clostridia bacterium]|nr:D-alanyl-D-alanine carboxypeptidase [Clostridia bacterium]
MLKTTLRRSFGVLIVLLLMMCPLLASATEDGEVKTNAKSSLLMDAASGEVLFEENALARLPIASVTKVMTLNLIFDAVESGQISLEEKITVSPHAQSMGGSQVFLDAGYEYEAQELIKAIIMASANDAAVAMAEQVAGSEEAFAAQMNKKAQKLGMTETHFANATGLPAQEHYSCARDVALMSRELLGHEDYFRWSTLWTDEIRHEKDGRVTGLVNTNRLIRTLAGCDGIKTGSTNEAGFCIAATAQRDGRRYIAVILGDATGKERFADAGKLLGYAFASFESKVMCAGGEVVETLPLTGGREKNVTVTARETLRVSTRRDGSETLETSLDLPETLQAPLQAGEVVGTLTVLKNGTPVAQTALVAQNDCPRAGFWDRLKDIFSFGK